MLGYNFFNPFAPQRVAPISAPVRPTLLPMPRPNYTPPVGGISSQQSAINAGFADPTGMTFETTAVVPAPAIMVDPVVNRNVTSEQSAKDGGFTTMGEAEVDMDGSTTPKSQADVAGAIGAVADFARALEPEPMAVPTAPAPQTGDYVPVANPYEKLDMLGKVAPRLGLKLSNI